VDRRTFIGSLGAIPLGATRDAPAQSTHKVYRIGVISSGAALSFVSPQPRDPSIAALLRGLRDLGYEYGKDYVIEPRGDDGMPNRLPDIAADLVRLQVDVIVGGGRQLLAALKQATSTIPIVMAASVDPVGEGLVRSLNAPGGNFTGLSLQSTEMTGKRLELLKEVDSTAAPVAILWSRDVADVQAAEGAARARGWKFLSLEVRDPREIEGAFSAARSARSGALLVLGSGIFFPHARRIAELAISSRLPTMFALRPYVAAGGLMSYGASLAEIWRSASIYVDKIFKGAKPAELPVEQPTKFELVINLKTAKALGVTIPKDMLLRADEVIQ
jgi:putative ABC transport system substrate-binding protein